MGIRGGVWEQGLAGRTGELKVLTECRSAVARGDPWLVMVLGEPGIGKTALVRRALAEGPDGLQVCWASCDQAERDIRYGVVSQLLHRLPAETAGRTELARSLTGAGSPLAVGRDLLDVVAATAESAPLALVVDDVPWADDQSLKTLAFMARRLWSERVLIVLVARTTDTVTGHPQSEGTGEEGSPPGDVPFEEDWRDTWRGFDRVSEIRLTGLGPEDIGDMVTAAGGPALNRAALQRLWEKTGGHPLHMQTLLGQVSPQELADTDRPLPVPASLEATIRQVLAELPSDARRLVQALAVLAATVPLAVAGRVADLADPTVALAPALASGLVGWQPSDPRTPVHIHHQLQRDSVYGALSSTERRDLHRLAADLVSKDAAWAHRVAAADGIDPALADRLAAEADGQAAAGQPARAATLRLWAADLDSTRERRERHLLTAATHLVIHERHARFRTLRGALEACDPTPRRDALLGFLAGLRGETAAGAELLSRATANAGADTESGLLAASWLAAVHVLQADGPRALAALRPVMDQLPHTHTGMALGLLSFATLFTDGPAAGLEVLRNAGLPDAAADVATAESFLLMYRGTMRVETGRLRAGSGDLAALIERQENQPHLPPSPTERYLLGFARYLDGGWEDALIAADHAMAAAEIGSHRHGVPPAHAVAAMVHAQRGHWTKARSHLEACSHHTPLFLELNSVYPAMAGAVLAQARADREAMLQALRPLAPTAVGNVGAWRVLWLPLLVQALAPVTPPDQPLDPVELDHVRGALALFDDIATHAPSLMPTSHWLHGRLATARGDTDSALARYREGHSAPQQDDGDIPLHRALLHHDHARLLISVDPADPHIRQEVVAHLQEAHRRFAALGATPYAERTAEQLTRLTGRDALSPSGTARLSEAEADGDGDGDGAWARPDGTVVRLPELTDREQSVAHLAAQGLTNKEIARRLFVSSKTVEYHLSHVYSKLAVTGRRELRREFQEIS
ncbi:AAA family ATPase [Kitasatospora sp. NPDC048540]|uniref:helix-turn-helix transcriptional regulator n=1 Tax=Kitasatospora sp. NPDC048540 TaxID=3155634 RepID=UPI0033D54C50